MKIFGTEVNPFSIWDIVQMLLGKHHPTASSSEGKHEAGLKASFMGAGENDEALFWSAVALAKQNGWIDQNGLKAVNAIFSKLNHEERNRLYKIIGRDEQNVVIEVHTKTTGTESVQGKRRRGAGEEKPGNEKEQSQKTTSIGNVRGALTISLLACMDPDEAVAFLRNSGTLSSISDDLEYLYKKLSEFLKETEVGEKIRKYLSKSVLWYLDAGTPEEAEKRASEKERELRSRQEQSWYERDLQKRPVLRKVWVALIMIIVIGGAYTFSH